MSFILSIETTTKSCSVAVSNNGNLLGYKEQVSETYSHSEQLTVFIQLLLDEYHLKTNDLSAIAVSAGPGSYTGLRIGVATAKGLCYALEIPLIAISTLESMAHLLHHKYPNATLCPMIDARRMEVYCAMFGNTVHDVIAKIIEPHSFSSELEQGPIIFFGDGADKCQAIISHPNAHFELGIFPSAKSMVQLAHQKFINNNFENVAYYEPFYLKNFAVGGKKT